MTHNALVAEGIARQKRAADPASSVWVSASAGSGKTRVLVERCLRLMLAGTPPEKILCITFTKAGAAEMSNRLNAVLGEWSILEDAALDQNLADLLGTSPLEAQRIAARRLFARVLDAPGGLKIQTIHSFCESVLGRFPLEARLAPNFEVMDERTATEIMQIARDDTLLASQRPENAALGDALRLIGEKSAEQQVEKLLKVVSSERSRFLSLRRRFGSVNSVILHLAERIGIDPMETEAHVIARASSEAVINGAALRRAVEYLLMGSDGDIARAEKIALWLGQPERRAELMDDYCSAYFTKDGKPVARLATKKVVEAWPSILDILEEERQRIITLKEQINKVRVFSSTSALLRLGFALIERYEAEKTRRGRLDYDDLILKTRDLLIGDGVTPWVMFKLDGGIEHILVDEAQDTSPEQWQVIAALAEEFFAGEGAARSERTLFVVGDEKQSIYSFQGADPATFDIMRRRFEEKATAAGKEWRNVPLDLSFRSAMSVLRLVDDVFAPVEARRGLTSAGDEVKHFVRRMGAAGLVEIWPTVKPPEDTDADPWNAPMTQAPDSNPPAELARRIASQIRLWLDSGEVLSATGEPVRPRDIMILVQKRNRFFASMVRALKLADIPVAGTDRMVLTDQLAVMDLMALARFVLLPEDDLNLAVVLKSPFVGCDDNQLFELAYGRKDSLWRALRENRPGLALFDTARALLSELLARADYVPVYEFFADILGRLGGRRALLRRLGAEAAEPIEEFLSLALAYQRTEATSLQGFLHWIEAGAAEIKRDMEQGRDEVRVLTVHGSKGLQAPIVFLPDTCQGTSASDPLLWTEDAPAFPLWPVKKENDDPATRAARELAKERALEERKRLLYVALTRAEDRLYICGWEGKTRPPADCWYNLIDPAFGEGVDEVELPWGEVARRWSSGKVTETAPERVTSDTIVVPLPAWIGEKAPDEPIPSRPLAPSREEDDTPGSSPLGDDGGRRFHRGLLIHRLLETLPSVRAEDRETVARRWLARPLHALDAEQQAEILNETLKVINDPDFAPIFAPGSLAEVPISGVFDGRVVTGQIDRLLIGEREILIIDYKTNRPSPRDIADVSLIYIRQMAHYRRAMQEMHPDKAVKCALLWTEGPHLMVLPADRM